MKIIVISYIYLYYFVKRCTGKNLKGLGYMQRFLKKPFYIKYRDKKVYYSPEIEGSYDCLLIGKSNEPETPLLFQRLIPKLNSCNFIDVGASIGEMVIDVSRYNNVNSVYAFEPRKLCCDAILKTLEVNKETRVKIFQGIVSTSDGEIELFENPGGTSSGMFNIGAKKSRTVRSMRLDSILPQQMDNPIMLIDVEGAEPLVLESGKTFIKNNLPLIIFEFNSTSKNHFGLNDIADIIGESYSFYRLKQDSSLDEDFELSWNAVAIPAESVFSQILNQEKI